MIRAAASFVQRGARHRAAGRPRGPRSARARKNLGIELGERHRDHQRRAVDAQRATTPPISTSACSARATCSATASAWSTRTATHFAACMVALDDADAMVTGVTRNFSVALEDVRRVIDPKPGHRVIGLSLVLSRGRTVLVADTAITEMPKAEELADIAVEAAGVARRMGYEPRLALLAFSTFGHPPGERSAHVIEAVKILDQRRVDFEYDGEMAADVALNPEAAAAYPFSRLTGPGQRADHAGVPFGVDLDQAAAGARRRDRDRPAAGRARPAGADRAARREGQPARQHGGARGVQCERVITADRRVANNHKGSDGINRISNLRALLLAALWRCVRLPACRMARWRQSYPSRPLPRWSLLSRPAGTTDAMARLLADKLSDKLGTARGRR